MTDVHLHTAIEQSPLGTVIFDPDGVCLLVNRAWHALWDVEGGETLSKGRNIFESDEIRAMGLVPYMKETMGDGAVTTPLLFYEAERIGSRRRPRWLRAFIYPVRDETGGLLEVGLILEDFTERKMLEDQLAHKAFHDTLTGLPNRALFLDRLGHALSIVRQNAVRDGDSDESKVALLFLDLDNFKYVNDSLGHDAGDLLLVEVARRIKACLRPGDTVARFGGDEFAALLEETEGADGAVGLAERIAQTLKAPIVIGGHEMVVKTSIGIVLNKPSEESGEDLLRRADIAMYRSKGGGKDRYEVFSEEMNGHELRRLKLEEDLRKAIEHKEFRIRYQPQMLLETGEVVGFEALLRWEHPERGLLEPSDFISLAEETGMIIPLGRWVLAEACRQARIFREMVSYDPPLKMSVNLSARQFRHPELVEEVTAALSESGLDPSELSLEITESVMMEEQTSAKVILAALKNLGLTLVMDDFGNGFSSISYLKKFPVDVLKMDRSMVEGVNDSSEDAAIVSATISLAHALGLEAVAEGIETTEELEELHSLGCKFGQGYYWRKPCPAEEALEMLEMLV